ncbi:hypothetical protein [Streptomyces malaysiense]|uniref:hypothetical protein n=1 Tax=Streptomyces malaysiense TaxID=1428626 RepID=UPI000A4AED64|nr:hypothetical protein [Streptomyces malaysiense]
MAASALCVDTVCTGPPATALGGVDPVLPAGLVVSAVAYTLPTRSATRSGLRPEHP